jgi:hypothetical protein
MARWLACAVVAAFIFGNGARAEDVTRRDRWDALTAINLPVTAFAA